MKAVCFRSISLFLAVMCLVCSFPTVFASEGEAALEVFSALSAESHFLVDADTGAVLSQQNADVRLPMASTTKIMTCLVALENADINMKVVIPQEAVGIEGSSVYLVKGESLTLLELLYALMLESANDAAVAIAFAVSGSIEAFADKMNEKAQEIGMTNSHFCNPHGLQAEEHYSTARDLSLLMCSALKNQQFAEISGTQTKTISAPEEKSRFLSNHNKLLRSYEDCIAGKTGYTKTAGRCLVTAAQRGGKSLVCTTLGDPNDWKDHKALFDYGFSLYTEKTLAEAGGIVSKIPVVGGVMSEVTVQNVDTLVLSLRAEEQVSSYLELPKFVYAPTLAGDVLGEAVFTVDGREVARMELICQETVSQREIKLSFWQKIWNTIKSWFE